MTTEIKDLIKNLQDLATTHMSTGLVNHTQQLPIIARLFAILGDQQAQSAAKVEAQTDKLIQQTDKLIKLTWGILIFSVALLLTGLVQLAIMFK